LADIEGEQRRPIAFRTLPDTWVLGGFFSSDLSLHQHTVGAGFLQLSRLRRFRKNVHWQAPGVNSLAAARPLTIIRTCISFWLQHLTCPVAGKVDESPTLSKKRCMPTGRQTYLLGCRQCCATRLNRKTLGLSPTRIGREHYSAPFGLRLARLVVEFPGSSVMGCSFISPFRSGTRICPAALVPRRA